MATTTRTRALSGGSRAQVRHTSGLPSRLASRVSSFISAIQASLPEVFGTPRFRRELLGVALILLALLSAYVIGRGGDEGRLVSWWGHSLERSLGRATFLVPILFALAALRAFGDQPGRVLEARHYLGGFTFALAVVGLLQLGARSVSPPAGGALGSSIAALTFRFLGPFGAGVALFCAGVLAILLLAGSDLQTFAADVRALCGALCSAFSFLVASSDRILTRVRGFLARVANEPPVIQEVGPPGSAVVEIKTTPKPRSARLEQLPVVEEVVPKLPPVINVPPRKPPVARETRTPDLGHVEVFTTAPLPLPDVARLAFYDDVVPDTDDLHGKARLIEETLASFQGGGKGPRDQSRSGRYAICARTGQRRQGATHYRTAE